MLFEKIIYRIKFENSFIFRYNFIACIFFLYGYYTIAKIIKKTKNNFFYVKNSFFCIFFYFFSLLRFFVESFVEIRFYLHR